MRPPHDLAQGSDQSVPGGDAHRPRCRGVRAEAESARAWPPGRPGPVPSLPPASRVPLAGCLASPDTGSTLWDGHKPAICGRDPAGTWDRRLTSGSAFRSHLVRIAKDPGKASSFRSSVPETDYRKTKYVFPVVNHRVAPGSTGRTGPQPPPELEVALGLCHEAPPWSFQHRSRSQPSVTPERARLLFTLLYTRLNPPGLCRPGLPRSLF